MERQRTPFLAPARATEGDGEAEDERRSPALDLLSARGTRALARTLARPRLPLVVVVIVVIDASAVVQSSPSSPRGARARDGRPRFLLLELVLPPSMMLRIRIRTESAHSVRIGRFECQTKFELWRESGSESEKVLALKGE